MLNSILLSAALLLGGPSVSTVQKNVEPQTVVAPFMVASLEMTTAIEAHLIEQHAAPHWDLSIETAWYYYRELHLITISEIEVDKRYVISYDGGILDVLIDPTDL